MLIQIDTREKPRAIKKIIETFERKRIPYVTSKLFFGDYQNLENPLVIVDRKQNLSELCSNVVQGHARFTKELERARDNGYTLVVLVEHGGRIHTLEDVKSWKNPRRRYSRAATTGEQLYKILSTMTEKYKFKLIFCNKENTGRLIVDILSAKPDEQDWDSYVGKSTKWLNKQQSQL